MNTWKGVASEGDKRKLGLAGDTRWWAKDTALIKMFGKFNKPVLTQSRGNKSVDLNHCSLYHIYTEKHF